MTWVHQSWGESTQSEIPSTLLHCKEIQVLGPSLNQFTGSRPREIGNLSTTSFGTIEQIDLLRNSLIGAIPTSFGNLTALQMLNLGGNNIQGNIPKELGYLFNLRILNLVQNNVMGIVPETIYFKHLYAAVPRADTKSTIRYWHLAPGSWRVLYRKQWIQWKTSAVYFKYVKTNSPNVDPHFSLASPLDRRDSLLFVKK